ncbi:MAG: sulfotransferase domain-containing protein, partial [Pseudomonadota bacterium]
QVAHPRAFKSHLRWDQVPKGGRYIVVLRDPVDAMVSFHRFMDGWFYERGSISLDDFAEHYLTLGPEGYWEHAASWWSVRDWQEVLLLTYEDMKEDLTGAVDKVADHMGGGYDADRRACATRQAEYSFMKAHADKFNDNLLRRIRDPIMGLPPTQVTGKVATGKTNVDVPRSIRDAFDRHWHATLGSQFGLASYQEMRDAVASSG